MKTVTNILEKNKIHIKPINSHQNKILSNSIKDNPTKTNKHVKQHEQHLRKATCIKKEKKNDHTKETEESYNLFDPKEKKTQVNKTQSQDREKELNTDRLNLNENVTSNSSLSCSK